MLTRFQKIYFGMARLGPSMMLDFISLATALFYYSLNDLPGIYTGISLAISYIVIAIIQFGFGYLSDRTPTERFGRRKPYVIIGAPLMALSFLFVFTPSWFINPSDTIGLFIYATLTLSMFKVFYGMVTTPFQSWMPELTEPEERPSVSSWQNVANFLAFIIGTLVTSLLAGLSIGWGLPPIILDIIIIMMIIEIVGFLPPLIGLHKEGKFIPQPSMRKELGIVLRNRDFVGWLVAQGLLSIGFAMVSSMAFPYVNDFLAFNLTDLVIFGVELLVVVFSFFLVWMWGIRRFGKRYTLQAAMGLAVAVLPFTLFVASKTAGFILIALLAAAIAGYFLFPYIIYADFAHKDELITGEGRAGVYTGFPAIPLNICQALSALIMGYILDLPKVLEVIGTPGKYVTIGYQYWGPVAAIFILLAILVLVKVDLDPDFEALAKEHASSDEPLSGAASDLPPLPQSSEEPDE
ncbi:MAG: MFS transporter [Candidatus Thorarchaeota archaeon]|nr:MFS transporter [Candidatus Thorarchaeota archaeon]